MNHKSIIPFIILSVFLSTSCVTEEPNGKWHAVEVNKDTWFVSEAGEEIIVELLNYSMWWIDCAYEEKGNYDNYLWPSSSSEQYDDDILDGRWFYAKVPHDGKGPRLEVRVSINEGSKERDAFISMSCGDVGKTIHIHQAVQNDL